MKSTHTSEPPLVTVITVCYNLLKNGRAGYFRQCLKSVSSQDYPAIEHLVIDGASQDGTVEQLEQYARQGVIRFISEPDTGIYDAMNKGIRLARGKYIAFLNSDDFWHRQDAISASVAALEQKEAAFSYAPRTLVHTDGSFHCTEAAGLGVFPCLMPFCHQTMFTRKDVLLRLGGFDNEHYRSAADYDLVFRLLLSGEPGVYVPLNFTSFRLGGFSVSDDELSGRECHLIRRRLLGKRAAALLQRGQMDDNLMLRIQELVHPRVAMDILRCFSHDSPGRYCLTYGLTRHPVEALNSRVACCSKQSQYLLFGFLPLIRLKRKPSRTDFYLFGFIPLLRLRRKRNMLHFRALFVLPILALQNR